MPPHCDSLDGPVVAAAREALDARDIDVVLPFVKTDGEAEVRAAFDRAIPRHNDGPAAAVADLHFFETVVRVHRAGEGAPYTGLKPAGLSVGPVIPVAERAIETGDAAELSALLADALRAEVRRRFEKVMHLKHGSRATVPQAREYVEAMLGLQVWSNDLFGAIHASPHASHGEHVHEA